jgi:hypothetical protein
VGQKYFSSPEIRQANRLTVIDAGQDKIRMGLADLGTIDDGLEGIAIFLAGFHINRLLACAGQGAWIMIIASIAITTAMPLRGGNRFCNSIENYPVRGCGLDDQPMIRRAMTLSTKAKRISVATPSHILPGKHGITAKRNERTGSTTSAGGENERQTVTRRVIMESVAGSWDGE